MKRINLNDLETFPIYGLPKRTQDVIEEVADARKAPRDFVAGAVITALSTAIGSRVIVSDDYKDPVNVYVALLGDSSDNKSTPAKDILKPLQEIHKTLVDESVRDRKIYETFMELDKKTQTTARAGGSAPEKPKVKQLILYDSTPEARLIAYRDNPRGLLLHRDELKGMFDDMNRYNKSGEDSEFIQVFNGDLLTKNRKAEGVDKVDNPWLSIFGTTQPKVLKTVFAKTTYLDSGLLPRFMWFSPTVKVFKDYTTARTPHQNIMDDWHRLIKSIYEHDFSDIVDWEEEGQDPPELYFDKGCRSLLDVFRNETGNYYNDYEATIMGKLQIFVYKLAGIAAIARYADGDYKGCAIITRDDIIWAIQCAYYFRRTGLYVESLCRTNQKTDKPSKEDTILTLLKLYPDVNQSQLAKALGISKQQITNVKQKM